MGRYDAVHADPGGAGDARPTALQVIKDESVEGALHDKVIVITGATSGIGLETARALSATGAHLILTVRDTAAAKAGPLKDLIQAGRVSLIEMDNASLTSVRKAAPEILAAANNQVNVLINNAGVMGIPNLMLTEDGHEVGFATNYLSHFLLFSLLRPALLASASSTFPSRVVNVSSSAHRTVTLPSSDDYAFEKGSYSFGAAYGRSKLALIYMANEIDRRYQGRDLHATSLHPGAIATNISRHLGQEFVDQLLNPPVVGKALKSPEQGAPTTVLAAVGQEWAHKGGKYLEDCAEAPRGEDDGDTFGNGYVRQTYDPKAENRLWSDSLKMLELRDEE